MSPYFSKIALIIAYLLKIETHSYKANYNYLINYKPVLNEKIRFNRVILTILDQKIYIIIKIEHYNVRKLKIISKI